MEQQSTSMTDAAQNQELEMAEALGFPSIGAMQKHFAEAEQSVHATTADKVELPFFNHNVGFLEVNAPDGLSTYGSDWKGFCVDGRDVRRIWYFGQSDGERSFSCLQANSPSQAILEAIQKNLISADDLDRSPQISNGHDGKLQASFLNGQVCLNAILARQESGQGTFLLTTELTLNTNGQAHQIRSVTLPLEVEQENLGDILHEALIEGRLLGQLVPSDSLLFDTESPVVAALTAERFGEWISSVLQDQGWQPEDGAAIASKNFETVVGIKEAVLYLHSHRVPPSYSLSGNYESEGRNILSSDSLLIKMDTPLDALRDAVSQQVAKFEKSIHDSFAARLYIQRGLTP